MTKATKAEYYLEVIMIAAKERDNEVLLQAVTELALRVGECVGVEVLRLVADVELARDARGQIDRTDWQTRKRLLFTAGMLLEIMRRNELAGHRDRTRGRDKLVSCRVNQKGRTGTYNG